MKIRRLMLLCLVLASVLVAGCAPQKAPKADIPSGYQGLRMLGGTLGSRSTTVVAVFANIFNKYYPEITWSSSSGDNATNPIFIIKGSAKLGTNSQGHYLAAYGWDMMSKSRLRSIILPSPATNFLFLIPEDKPWKDISEVPKGLTLNVGTGMTAIICEEWLKLAGLSKKDFNSVSLGKSESADAWRTGKVDLYFSAIAGADPVLYDLMTSPRKIKPMGLSLEQAAKAKAEQTFERAGGEAPVESPLPEIAPEFFKNYSFIAPQTAVFVNSRDDFPEEIAYRMAKILDERHAELAQTFSPLKYATPQQHIKWAKPPVDIHPGVARYYREKGYLK